MSNKERLIRVRRLKKLEDISDFQWNGLLIKSETNVVFLTYEWIRCWWKCLSENHELFILIAEESDQIVGIAPLMLSVKNLLFFKYRVIEFIGAGESDYCDFIVTPEYKMEILKAMFSFLKNRSALWDIISLCNIPGQSNTPLYLRKLVKNVSLRMKYKICHICFALSIQDDPDFAQKCLRKRDLRSRLNFLKRNGILEYNRPQSEKEVLAELETFFQYHVERWMVVGENSKLQNQKVKEFYKCLVGALFPNGWLNFSILRFNNEPIAYHFGFEYIGKLVRYKSTFNIDHFKRSPGSILLKFIIEECIQKDISELDFTIGDESYKSRFANVERENLRFDIFNSDKLWIISEFIDHAKKLKQKHKTISFVFRVYHSIFSVMSKCLDIAKKMNYLTKIRDFVSRNGVPLTVFKLIKRILKYYIFRVEHLLVYQRYTDAECNSIYIKDISISEGRISELREFMQSEKICEKEDIIRKAYYRLKAEDILHIAKYNESIVHYAWVSFKNEIYLSEVNAFLRFDNDSAYIYDCYTHRDFRGQGIYPAMLCYLTKSLREQGKKNVFISFRAENISSKKEIEKAGFKPFTDFRCVRIFGICINHLPRFLNKKRKPQSDKNVDE